MTKKLGKSLEKASSSAKHSLYRIVHDSELDKVWSFPLFVDFEKGDLIIL